MDKVTVQVNAPDVINLTSDAGDNITLSSTAMIVLPSSGAGAGVDTAMSISTDPNNELKLGSDNKLLVDISDVQSEVAANTHAIEQLQSASSVDLSPLSSRITTLEGDVASHTQAIEQLQGLPVVDLAPLDARVATLESDIDTINQAQAAQDTAISAKAAQSSLDATNKTIADNYTALDSAIAQKTSINDKVS